MRLNNYYVFPIKVKRRNILVLNSLLSLSNCDGSGTVLTAHIISFETRPDCGCDF